jgi:hypothetical protein
MKRTAYGCGKIAFWKSALEPTRAKAYVSDLAWRSQVIRLRIHPAEMTNQFNRDRDRASFNNGSLLVSRRLHFNCR